MLCLFCVGFLKKRERKKEKIAKLIFKTSYIQHKASLPGPANDGGRCISKRDSQTPERPVTLCIPDSTGKTEESLGSFHSAP